MTARRPMHRHPEGRLAAFIDQWHGIFRDIWHGLDREAVPRPAITPFAANGPVPFIREDQTLDSDPPDSVSYDTEREAP